MKDLNIDRIPEPSPDMTPGQYLWAVFYRGIRQNGYSGFVSISCSRCQGAFIVQGGREHHPSRCCYCGRRLTHYENMRDVSF